MLIAKSLEMIVDKIWNLTNKVRVRHAPRSRAHTHRVSPLSRIIPICATGGSLHRVCQTLCELDFGDGRLVNSFVYFQVSTAGRVLKCRTNVEREFGSLGGWKRQKGKRTSDAGGTSVSEKSQDTHTSKNPLEDSTSQHTQYCHLHTRSRRWWWRFLELIWWCLTSWCIFRNALVPVQGNILGQHFRIYIYI
jgi:hypothetical protein